MHLSGDDFRNQPENAPLAELQEKYRPELDGIRAICIVFTILHHIPRPIYGVNGETGVDIFFSLSGWLITSLLIKECRLKNSIDLASFWIRRVFRIAPLYYVTAAIYIILSLADAKVGSANQLQYAFIYMISMCMEYRPAGAGSLFGHAWTLGIEEKFYIIWPMIMAFTVRRPILQIPLAFIFFSCLALFFGMNGTIISGYFGLVIGASLAILTTRWIFVRRVISYSISSYIFLLLLVLFYVCSVEAPGYIFWNLGISAASAFLIASLWLGGGTKIGHILQFGPLPWLGRLTYAMYLVQSLCVRLVMETLGYFGDNQNTFVVFLLAYALSVGIGGCAHYFIERPMIRVGRKLAKRGALPKQTMASET